MGTAPALAMNRWMEADAEAQFEMAENRLATLLQQALPAGSEPQHQQAAQWYRKAADSGISKAQYRLAHCFIAGEGVPVNEREGARLLLMAAKQGHAGAMFDMSVCYRSGYGSRVDKETAAHLLIDAANQGHTDAMVEIGLCFWHGEGIIQDDFEALKWWRKASAVGSAVAEYSLG